jgi:hypothetical protein
MDGWKDEDIYISISKKTYLLLNNFETMIIEKLVSAINEEGRKGSKTQSSFLLDSYMWLFYFFCV